MVKAKSIKSILEEIDGRGYKAYRKLTGASETVKNIRVEVVKVQGDPYAPPSIVKATTRLNLPSWCRGREVAVADWITRRLYRELSKASSKVGEGRSGYLGIPRPSPIIIRRSSVEILGNKLIARIRVGLPSKRRRILGTIAEELLLEKIPKALGNVIDQLKVREKELRVHVRTWDMQEYIRRILPEMKLVSFIGDGSILPRKCGGCEEPLPNAVPFESPPSLRVEIELPWNETITGMGVRQGITLVMGSAFHGKSTLIEAIASGVWNHIPGDGREKVVTIRNAMYVRAEDGRYVSCVDVSPMIYNLPGGVDTKCFTTRDASGATSTVASIQEAVEVGAKLIVLDEDTVATNVLYIDERIQGVIKHKTITPLSLIAKSMNEKGISLIIASSGTLELACIADTIILMDEYKAIDVTSNVKKLCSKNNGRDTKEYHIPPSRIIHRVQPLHKPKIKGYVLEDRSLPAPIPIQNIHVQEKSQYNSLVAIARRIMEFRGRRLVDIVHSLEDMLRNNPYRLVGDNPDIGEVRALDIAYMLNRLPIISFKPSM